MDLGGDRGRFCVSCCRERACEEETQNRPLSPEH